MANDTYLYDNSGTVPGNCLNTNVSDTCIAFRGGLFQPNTDQGWQQTNSDQADSSDDTFGTDTVKLGDVTLKGFPLHLLSANKWSMNALGLGPSSRVLQQLKDKGHIQDRVYGIFQGLLGTEKEHQMDGSVVLGGYDRAKVKGANSTQFITNIVDDNCNTGLILSVSDISMGFSNGSSLSILGANNVASQFCLVPGIHTLQLPGETLTSFINNAGGTFIGFSNGTDVGALFEAEGV
jgi:hypothetical protein